MAHYKNEILLINPPSLFKREIQDENPFPHLGLGYIAAYLRHKGFECRPIDAKFERIDLEKLSQKLKKYRPGLVGITAMTHDVKQAAKAARIAKELFPEAVIVLGGPHATALPEETLRQFSEFDIAAAGEGEITMYELANGNPPSTIKGIAYREGKGIKLTASRDFIKNLDELPLPAWDLFPSSRVYPILINRGCSFRCNFCMRVSGNTTRKRSLDNVLKELESDVKQRGATLLYVNDESFGIDRKQTSDLLDAIIESGLAKNLKWVVQTRVDIVSEEFLQKLKAAGCSWIGFGVESGNEKILEASGKGIILKKVEDAVALAKRAGLETGAFFIIGHPHETKETVLDTINFAAKLNTSNVAFGIMVPYPGTKIYEMALKGEGGYRIISSDWADFNKTIGSSLELETLSRKDMEKLQLLGYFLFYLKNSRLWELLKLFLRERKVVWAITKKIFT